MSTFVDFLPSSTAVFQFLATLAKGVQYNIATPWNAFGERYYVTVSDLSGLVILHRPIAQSGPVLRATLTWDGGIATASLASPHNVPVGGVANARVSQTNSPFDGSYEVLAVGPQTLIFAMTANPNVPTPLAGNLDFPLDLLAGCGIGSLYFHSSTQQFEF